MQIKTLSNSEYEITGNIKSYEDYQNIKNALTLAYENGTKSMSLLIPESMSMTSSVIGFLLKLVQKEHVALKIEVGNHTLFELLSELGLVDAFKVTKSARLSRQ